GTPLPRPGERRRLPPNAGGVPPLRRSRAPRGGGGAGEEKSTRGGIISRSETAINPGIDIVESIGPERVVGIGRENIVVEIIIGIRPEGQADESKHDSDMAVVTIGARVGRLGEAAAERPSRKAVADCAGGGRGQNPISADGR